MRAVFKSELRLLQFVETEAVLHHMESMRGQRTTLGLGFLQCLKLVPMRARGGGLEHAGYGSGYPIHIHVPSIRGLLALQGPGKTAVSRSWSDFSTSAPRH